VGTSAITEGRLGEFWEADFKKFHPGVNFSFNMAGKEVGVAPLYYQQADIAIIEEPGFYDLLPYERIMSTQPLRVASFMGSYNMSGYMPAFYIIVNKDNPLTHVTMEQLDYIFGSKRQGGWVGTNFDPKLARGQDKNIRTWGQAGLSGEWTQQKITPYSYSVRDPVGETLSDFLIKGSDHWNESLRAYGPYVDRNGVGITAEEQIIQGVIEDKYGIGAVLGGFDLKDVKVLSVAPPGSTEYIRISFLPLFPYSIH
jgi:phosphate transport system substrate-binding protein